MSKELIDKHLEVFGDFMFAQTVNVAGAPRAFADRGRGPGRCNTPFHPG